MRGNLFIESPKETFDTLFLNILFLLIKKLHLHGTIYMVQLTWQESPEVVRKYKKALETLNMLILPHLKKKKRLGEF